MMCSKCKKNKSTLRIKCWSKVLGVYYEDKNNPICSHCADELYHKAYEKFKKAGGNN